MANSGETATGTVTVTDDVPTGTTYVAGSASCGSTADCAVGEAGGVITWTLSNVAAGAIDNLTFEASVDADDTDGSTISNAGAFTNVNTGGCSTATCTTNSVTNPVSTPASIDVTKSEGSPGSTVSVTAGSTTVDYFLAVTNSGGTESTPVTVTDDVPTGTTYVGDSVTCESAPAGNCSGSESAGTVTWTLTVPAGTTYNIGFEVTVDAGDSNGSTISNVAEFTNVNSPGCSDATCSTNTVTNPVLTPASIEVTKSESTPGATDIVVAGTDISYGLAVTNTGGFDSGSVTVTDHVPTGTTYVSSMCGTSLGCTVGESAGLVTWVFDSVPAGTTEDVGLVVSVDAGDTDGSSISNTASFTNVNTPGCSTTSSTCDTNTVTNPFGVVPSVVSPTSGATNVTADPLITVTFNEAVNLSAGVFTLTCGGNPESYSFNPSGPNSAYVITTEIPAGGQVCMLTVTAADVADSVSGLQMLSNDIVTFTMANDSV